MIYKDVNSEKKFLNESRKSGDLSEECYIQSGGLQELQLGTIILNSVPPKASLP